MIGRAEAIGKMGRIEATMMLTQGTTFASKLECERLIRLP